MAIRPDTNDYLSEFIWSNSVYANMSYLSLSGQIVPRAIQPYSGLRFDVMNKLNAHSGLFVGQKVAAAAGAHM